jgi:hypothetical protein
MNVIRFGPKRANVFSGNGGWIRFACGRGFILRQEIVLLLVLMLVIRLDPKLRERERLREGE